MIDVSNALEPLAKILSRWELELVDKRDIHPKRRGLVTAPERPIELLVKSQRLLESLTLATAE